MTTTTKQLLWTLFIFTATLTNINAGESGTSLRGYNPDVTTTDSSLDLSNTSLNPLSKLQSALDRLNWDPVTIANTAYDYWQNPAHPKLTQQVKNKTILTTVCSYTAPWVLAPLMELQTRPYHKGVNLPQDPELIIYNNIPHPASLLSEPPVQNIRDFINSRPSNESIVIQIDLIEHFDHFSHFFHDHHFMIHSYDGKINLYQSWVNQFTLLNWMKESFDSRYPMDKDTFLHHFEKLLTMPEAEEHDLRLERDESIWAIMGRTNTMEYYTTKTGEKMVNDLVTKLLRNRYYAKLITYWPNA